MLRLLIVDDEPVIADAMFDILSDAGDLDLDIYRAFSGEEAIGWMHRMKIDILLTDISMPGMNGLEVQRRVLEMWPACRVIFLTGHNEFDYIQSAMRNEGCDYILKTEPEEVVITAVRKAVREIGNEMEREKLLESAEKSMRLALPVLQSRCLSDILEGMIYEPSEIKSLFSQFQIPLDAGQPVMLLVGKIDRWPEGLSGLNRMQMIYAIQDIAGEQLNPSAAAVPVVYDRMSIIWFIQPVPSAGFQHPGTETAGWGRIGLMLHSSMDIIQLQCKCLHSVSMSFAASRSPVSWEKAAMKYESLKQAMDKGAMVACETLLIEEGLQDEETGEASAQNEFTVRSLIKKVDTLRQHVEKGEEAEFFKLFHLLMDSAQKSKLHSLDISTEIYYQLSAMLLSILNRWKIAELVGHSHDMDKLKNMNAFKNWEEITAYFSKLAKCIFDYRENEGLRNANRIFGFIRNYVQQNLAGDLSLTQFAELLNFHPFYLSRLFRQVTGKTLTEYISAEKMKKAKELLENSNLKVHEIAATLGFETPSYFIRFFKKHANVTPQEHRNSLG